MMELEVGGDRRTGSHGSMTPEFWAIIGVGIGMAGLFFRTDVGIGRLDDHVRARGERLAKLEGKVDTLIAAFATPREE